MNKSADIERLIARVKEYADKPDNFILPIRAGEVRALIEAKVVTQERTAFTLQMKACLEAILRYKPNEICKDEFAYDRMVENYRDAARCGLKESSDAE